MPISRTTIMASDKLIARVDKHTNSNGEKLHEFYTRAILNQLEKEGDWTIRDEMEEELNEHKESN